MFHVTVVCFFCGRVCFCQETMAGYCIKSPVCVCVWSCKGGRNGIGGRHEQQISQRVSVRSVVLRPDVRPVEASSACVRRGGGGE